MSKIQKVPPGPDMPKSSKTCWVPISYMKLHFFARIRRFLQSKTTQKQNKPRTKETLAEVTPATTNNSNNEEDHGKSSTQYEEHESALVLQMSVKRLHFGSLQEKEVAAMEIERLAKDEDVQTRKLMADLGVIPALVAMLASQPQPPSNGGRSLCVAARALIELANGTFTNKALMVEAGIFTKLPKNVNNLEEPTMQQFAQLILILTFLISTEFPLTSIDQIVQFLLGVLECCSILETKASCLCALYNLSVAFDNVGKLVSNGAIQSLLKLISEKELSEKALATLANLVVNSTGKRQMEDSSIVPECLIEIMSWEDKPKCQELSAYILMILAHQSWPQREKMAKSGIVPVLIELALLGSPLAQKRAIKLLQWFKDERQVKMGPHSGPQVRRVDAIGSPLNERVVQEGKRMMKNLVKESLHKNLEIITQRANNGNCDGQSSSSSCNKSKSFVGSTSSKSLPH